jgi:hypothetical protein
MKSTTSRHYGTTIVLKERTNILLRAAILGAAFMCWVSVAQAQVYGVAKKTAVVSGPNGTVAASKTTVVGAGGAASKTTVVATGSTVNTVHRSSTVVVTSGGLPHGYIAVVPSGYRVVTVSGVRYYTAGGVYYRPQMYQGRTVYVAVRF